MQIIEMQIDSLREYENNPRNNDLAVEKVAASIHNFGFKVPIIVDKNNVIVAGHTRLKALKRLGWETVPCVIADDLTDEQIKAFRLADNKVAEYSRWDTEKLKAEYEKITGIDLSVFGFEKVEEASQVNVEDFFEEAEPKEKEPTRVQCEHCGEWFEV